MVNKVILLGNLGQDPEIRYAQSGSKIASFSVATSESWKDKISGERKTLTQWHKVVVFNDNLADVVEKYIKKGSKVYLEGALQSRKYTGSDGVEKNITEVVISQFKGEIQIIDSRNSGESSENIGDFNSKANTFSAPKTYSAAKKEGNIPTIGDDLDDEIPF
ncbi:Single-stranded DNA-binding protein [Candidatus Hepatincolaceae symbiont of Richtersius coronifer]